MPKFEAHKRAERDNPCIVLPTLKKAMIIQVTYPCHSEDVCIKNNIKKQSSSQSRILEKKNRAVHRVDY